MFQIATGSIPDLKWPPDLIFGIMINDMPATGKTRAMLADDLKLALGEYVKDPLVSEISPITGPEYQLFIFFMITDPKTTVRTRTGQCVVAFLVAAVEMVLRLHSCIYAPLYALFLVGPPALLLESWWSGRRLHRSAVQASLPA